jgi:hypothetical protein
VLATLATSGRYRQARASHLPSCAQFPARQSRRGPTRDSHWLEPLADGLVDSWLVARPEQAALNRLSMASVPNGGTGHALDEAGQNSRCRDTCARGRPRTARYPSPLKTASTIRRLLSIGYNCPVRRKGAWRQANEARVRSVALQRRVHVSAGGPAWTEERCALWTHLTFTGGKSRAFTYARTSIRIVAFSVSLHGDGKLTSSLFAGLTRQPVVFDR